eukprot:11235-Pleurochrysis_carterae.AAC.1
MHFDVIGEREHVEVESPALGRERAEEGSDIGRHLEAFEVHTEPRTEGEELLKVAVTARVGHEAGCAEDVAHMELRVGGKIRGIGVQILEHALGGIVLCFVVRE